MKISVFILVVAFATITIASPIPADEKAVAVDEVKTGDVKIETEQKKVEDVKADKPTTEVKAEEPTKPEPTPEVKTTPVKEKKEQEPSITVKAEEKEEKPAEVKEVKPAKAEEEKVKPATKPEEEKVKPATKAEEVKVKPAKAEEEKVKPATKPEEEKVKPATKAEEEEKPAEVKPVSKPSEKENETPAADKAKKSEPALVQSRASAGRALAPETRRTGKKYNEIQIVQLESELHQDGHYKYNFETDDGSVANQEGELKGTDEEHMGESVKGGFSYKDEEGKTFSLQYTADENGYRPVGDHLPVPPPIPPQIARALAWAATAKPWVDPELKKPSKTKQAKALAEEATVDKSEVPHNVKIETGASAEGSDKSE